MDKRQLLQRNEELVRENEALRRENEMLKRQIAELQTPEVVDEKKAVRLLTSDALLQQAVDQINHHRSAASYLWPPKTSDQESGSRHRPQIRIRIGNDRKQQWFAVTHVVLLAQRKLPAPNQEASHLCHNHSCWRPQCLLWESGGSNRARQSCATSSVKTAQCNCGQLPPCCANVEHNFTSPLPPLTIAVATEVSTTTAATISQTSFTPDRKRSRSTKDFDSDASEWILRNGKQLS